MPSPVLDQPSAVAWGASDMANAMIYPDNAAERIVSQIKVGLTLGLFDSSNQEDKKGKRVLVAGRRPSGDVAGLVKNGFELKHAAVRQDGHGKGIHATIMSEETEFDVVMSIGPTTEDGAGWCRLDHRNRYTGDVWAERHEDLTLNAVMDIEVSRDVETLTRLDLVGLEPADCAPNLMQLRIQGLNPSIQPMVFHHRFPGLEWNETAFGRPQEELQARDFIARVIPAMSAAADEEECVLRLQKAFAETQVWPEDWQTLLLEVSRHVSVLSIGEKPGAGVNGPDISDQPEIFHALVGVGMESGDVLALLADQTDQQLTESLTEVAQRRLLRAIHASSPGGDLFKGRFTPAALRLATGLDRKLEGNPALELYAQKLRPAVLASAMQERASESNPDISFSMKPPSL